MDDLEDLVQFNLSVLLGFKAVTVCTKILNFVKNGTLPNRRRVKRINMIVYGIWFSLAIFPLLNVIIDTVWEVNNHDYDKKHSRHLTSMKLFGFVDMLLYASLFMLYLIICLKLKKLRHLS